MKIGILSESKVDEAAYKILVESVLDRPVEIMKSYRRRGGWAQAKALVRAIIRDLHFASADGFVFVGDSDSTPPHAASHDELPDGSPGCRLCEIRQIVAAATQGLRDRSGQPRLKTAVGMATPTIEAWLLSGLEPNRTEAWFRQEHSLGKLSGQTRRDLKTRKYGSLEASADIKLQRTLENAQRIADDLDGLERRFQFGFGHLRNDLAQW
ncbi:MAG: hypothetical protein IIB99_08695 [Planctomycetes bacterium]|nr:hypothetical protein [Planctomycetota bacterium]